MSVTARRSFIIISVIINTGMVLKAQNRFSRYEAGISAGTFIYQGDLTPSAIGSLKTMKPGLNLFVSKKLTNSFSFRTNLAITTLYGNDGKYNNPAWRQQRNFMFRSSVAELTGLIVWDPTAQNFSTTRSKLSPYLFAGAGIAHLNIKRDWSNFNASWFASETNVINGLDADAKKTLPAAIPVLPVGAGIRYSLAKNLSLSFETTYRFTKTDYLDGFSLSANPSKGDHYWSNTIGIILSFGKTNSWKCPKISK